MSHCGTGETVRYNQVKGVGWNTTHRLSTYMMEIFSEPANRPWRNDFVREDPDGYVGGSYSGKIKG
ncbi:hypothetical protein P9E76_11740 [Schinkia azotoformans]|uniref:Uncharacterized protein n=1 Tax=Schinkia azotoformans LMG 9581 TaxID=1131731 RepID=K6E5Y0_SCHAZ|nr:hypothetical protein [Schinkia azotoformans]EKN68681.1 hypothetical protein BAZO_03460 [Schinkia azotoformans LMG 9581]MEC1640749.1 hypothetical protein [Schinkia azotoformans]MEC1720223.1 hypothetical protein [Schinkia azotoformans]MEC1945715.1 hypothetical protein [Schinkia azotoformans]MED4353648.1 hypothetical protein [Schinkia azotoformans]